MSGRVASDREVLALRQAGQLLHRPGPQAPHDVARKLVGVQAQDMFAAPLAIRARSRGLTAAAVRTAIEDDRDVVRTWAMRGTLHLLAAEDLVWLDPLTAAPQLPAAVARLARLGAPADRAERAVGAIGRMLATHGPLTRADIARRLRRNRVPQGQAVIHLIRLAALRGTVCCGPDADGEGTFVLIRDWLGRQDRAMAQDAAPTELAARYLAAHAPADEADLAAWSGLRASEARRAWEGIAHRLVQVATPRGPLWRLRSGPRPVRSAVVRLVPAFDPSLLGWRTRDLSLPRRHERRVFPGGGIFRPAVLSDGVAVGTWSVARRGNPRDITIRPFSGLADRERRAAEADAADVVRFLEPGVEPRIAWE